MNSESSLPCPNCFGKLLFLGESWPKTLEPDWGGQVLYCPACDLGVQFLAHSRVDTEILLYERSSKSGSFVLQNPPYNAHALFDEIFSPAKVASLLSEVAERMKSKCKHQNVTSGASVFLEVVFRNSTFPFQGRDEVEDPLSEALVEAQLGEITGGGSGPESCHLDIEVTDLEQGLRVIRNTLRRLGFGDDVRIHQRKPIRKTYHI